MMKAQMHGEALFSVSAVEGPPGVVLIQGIAVTRAELRALRALLETAEVVAGPGPWQTRTPEGTPITEEELSE